MTLGAPPSETSSPDSEVGIYEQNVTVSQCEPAPADSQGF